MPAFALSVPPVFDRASPRGERGSRRLFLPLTTPYMACHSLRQPFALGIRPAVVWAAILLLLVGACKKADEIRDYTVANPPGPAETHRMLAAVVPDERSPEAAEDSVEGKQVVGGDKDRPKEPQRLQAWFFKIVGPIDQVKEATAAFDQFVASIRMGKEERPEWTLPEGWKEDSTAAARQFGREATIRVGQGESQLELAVSKLPMPKDRRESWLLGNINRWRGQLQLPSIARSELEEYTEELKAGDETATKVDFRGAYSGPPAAGMFAAKDAHGGTAAAATPSRDAATKAGGAATAGAKRPLPFDAVVPGDWKPGRMNEFRVAAYNVGGSESGATAEMTVTPLGPAAGDLKANVDRWRGEIKLPPATTGELAELTKSIEVDGQKADYVHLVGPEDASPREATLGVILRRPDRVWFFKLRGPAVVVERQKAPFEEYVKSVKFK
ncbi:MAG: hypothetical protein WD894_16865 [Pirellulales bacterium]